MSVSGCGVGWVLTGCGGPAIVCMDMQGGSSIFVEGGGMSTKTIRIDLEAYRRLVGARRGPPRISRSECRMVLYPEVREG